MTGEGDEGVIGQRGAMRYPPDIAGGDRALRAAAAGVTLDPGRVGRCRWCGLPPGPRHDNPAVLHPFEPYRFVPQSLAEPVYRQDLAPHAVLEVEQSGNIVLVVDERRITVTDVARWVGALTVARQAAQAMRSAEGE
jgi:hypothetical protein